MAPPSPPPTWTFLPDRGSESVELEEDQFQTSLPPHQPTRADPLTRKRPAMIHNNESMPLFLPESDEEREQERSKKKKRRISTKATQHKTLHDLWDIRKGTSTQQNPGQPLSGPSNLPAAQKPKKKNIHNRSYRKSVSSIAHIQATHPTPAPEVIEISDSDEPDPSSLNQGPANFPTPLPKAVTEVIEIPSSDEDTPQSPIISPPILPIIPHPSPGRSRQSSTEVSLNHLVLPSTPSQRSPPPTSQLPLISSPSEGETAMEDVSSAAALQTILGFPVDNSITQDTRYDDEAAPPPPSSSPSCYSPLSRHPTPTVRYLLYGGANGIFGDANTSILQQGQTILNQNNHPSPPIPLHAQLDESPPAPDIIPSVAVSSENLLVSSPHQVIDLTRSSDTEDQPMPDIGSDTTRRANILRSFFDQSSAKSPTKSTSASPGKSFSFLDMIRLQKGFPVESQLPENADMFQGPDGEIEDKSTSTRTRESSITDTEAHPHNITLAKLSSRTLAPAFPGASINDLIPSPAYYRLSDLPTSLLDHINAIPDSVRKSLVFRQMFEAVIAENTANDEPEAPPITVINEIDDEPTPPWEFFYSNKLWYHEDVPPPDYSKLVGCDCVGECDPKSPTCACLRRQNRLWPEGEPSGFGFSYDEEGMLKNWDETVIECNDLCQCTSTCRNRVVQNGRKVHINIVKTEQKGWGVFAGERMEAGTFLGIYSGELITEAVGEARKLYNEYGRTYLFDLRGNNYVVDAFHIGNFTRFLNHSCAPNCWMKNVVINEHTKRKCILALFTLEAVEANQELSFSYFGSLDSDVKIEQREDIVNGKCYCGAPGCIGTLFPRITRDEESGDEGGNEGEPGIEDDGIGDDARRDADGGDDMDLNV